LSSGRRSTQSTLSTQTAFVVVALLCVACGKKGPPLPPLVKLPVPPADLVAERRGASVDLQFTVPVANTDGSKPANVASVDIYAITPAASLNIPPPPGQPAALTDADILKYGTKVGSVAVKAPKDPNQTVDEDEPDADVEPPEGAGLDQGAIARIAEELTPGASVPVTPKTHKPADLQNVDPLPLLPPPSTPPSRTYVTVGVSARGKKGPVSRRVAVPLVPPPPAPADPKITYTETAVTLAWTPPVERIAGDPDLLPSRPLGPPPSAIAFNVYEVPADAPSVPVKLTKTPIPGPTFEDARITWGEKRCYQVRAVATVAGTAVESAAPPNVCETLVDKFPPAAPKSLQAVPSERSISLIWEPNAENDLAGYIVLRGSTEADLQPIVSEPITATTFNDGVQSGRRYTYAVRAVDKAGNASPLSNAVAEIAR